MVVFRVRPERRVVPCAARRYRFRGVSGFRAIRASV